MTYAVKVIGGDWHITEQIPIDIDCLEKVIDLDSVCEVEFGETWINPELCECDRGIKKWIK